MTAKRILSGMQPTNQLHLGNYLGALKNWVALQDQDYECLFCVVDLHAITMPYDRDKLAQATREIAAAYIAAGIDPAKCPIFPQSAVPAHSELMWLFATMTQMGKLERMTQFKDKAGKNKERAGLGLFSYPVLMAADILLYKATHVPVGEDQKQHLELTREIAATFNARYQAGFFPQTEPMILGEATRVMSLRDGTSKMSKSAESDMSRINLTDDADTIVRKIRKAKTDPAPLGETIESLQGRPEALNLVTIYAALAGVSRAEVLAQFGGQPFSVFKPALADLAVETLSPMTGRMTDLLSDPAEIDRILASGADKARALAEPVLRDVREIMGFWRG
ncbi:MAG: tryptophan--tRNA ligase [Alphaproteobacteria bacterium]|nr:tryptophan--tRNA ligase [Alphaproteobacteria bacterium]